MADGLRSPGWCICLALAVVASGCYESTLPVSAPGKVRVDTSLLGTWACVPPWMKPGERATLRVFSFDGAQYYLEWTERAELTRARAYGSDVRGTVLLNVQPFTPSGLSGNWIFARYRAESRDIVRFAIVSEDTLTGLPASDALRTIARRVRDESLFEPSVTCQRE